MNVNATPGPWVAEGNLVLQVGPARLDVAETNPSSNVNALGDARLIAAAPEMVELLREAATERSRLPGRSIGEWLGLVRALLARIESGE